MKALVPALLLVHCAVAIPQETTQARELTGIMGSRTALMITHAVQRSDGGWRVTGEYFVLPTLQRRFLEGERGPELGVTTLQEGASAIFFGHDPIGELRGLWRGGVFKGTRYAPGGQERERFRFSESFPSMDRYSASVRCESADPEYRFTLQYAFEEGQAKGFAWRSRAASGEQGCALPPLEQQAFEGGLRLAAGGCRVTLRELGETVKVAAEGCARHCAAQATLEPVLVDRGGNCRLLRPEAR